MSGKFQNKFAVSFCFLLLINVALYPQENTDNITINGYLFDSSNHNYNKGIRLQGIGDYFFKSRNFPKAITYYEQALTFLPTEADITFKLAQIYQHEKLWRLSILYYEETIKLLQNKINYNKSQLNTYISRIKIAYIHHLQGNTEESIALVTELRKEQSVLISLYPEAWEELKIFNTIYPETAIRTTQNIN